MIDVNHLTVLLNELSSHTVGLNGKDFLTIHYDFFAAVSHCCRITLFV